MPNHEIMRPVLSEDIDICSFSEECTYLVTQHKTGFRLKINQHTYTLLKYINGTSSLAECVDKYNSDNYDDLNIESAYKVLSHLSTYGIIEGLQETPDIRKVTGTYLKLRITLLKKSFLDKFTKHLGYLFRPPVFYTVLILSYLTLIPITVVFFDSLFSGNYNFTIVDLAIGFLLLGLILFFHEIGHVSACRAFGAKHGDIGFGFYLLTPVMFADVTDIWRLPVKKRIIVNLAGMYFGNITAILCLIIYYLTGAHFLFYIAILSFLDSLFNLNPFVKYDGYWVLSDLIKVPNLHRVSYSKIKYVFTHLKICKTKDWVLAMYGLLSISFIVLFLGYVLLFNTESILFFPLNVYKYVSDLVRGTLLFNLEHLTQFILPSIFYYMAIRYIIILSKYYLNRKQKHLETV